MVGSDQTSTPAGGVGRGGGEGAGLGDGVGVGVGVGVGEGLGTVLVGGGGAGGVGSLGRSGTLRAGGADGRGVPEPVAPELTGRMLWDTRERPNSLVAS